jgi:hypothetical protein
MERLIIILDLKNTWRSEFSGNLLNGKDWAKNTISIEVSKDTLEENVRKDKQENNFST